MSWRGVRRPSSATTGWRRRAVTADQRVSTNAADSIRAGLGPPSDDVSADVLAEAAGRLLDSAGSVDADRVLR